MRRKVSDQRGDRAESARRQWWRTLLISLAVIMIGPAIAAGFVVHWALHPWGPQRKSTARFLTAMHLEDLGAVEAPSENVSDSGIERSVVLVTADPRRALAQIRLRARRLGLVAESGDHWSPPLSSDTTSAAGSKPRFDVEMDLGPLTAGPTGYEGANVPAGSTAIEIDVDA